MGLGTMGVELGKQPGGGGAVIGFADTTLARAQALLGTTIDSISWTDFDTDQWYTAIVAGTGTATLTTDRGGVLRLDSGAVAAGQAAITPHGATGGALALVANQRTERWYVRGRIQFPTAIDAQASIGIWITLNTTTTPYVFFGAAGSISTAFFSAQLSDDVGTTTNVFSTFVIDTLWHTLEMWNDLANVFFAIDGVLFATTPSTNLGTGKGQPYAWSKNGTTAASRQLKLDKLAYCYAGQ